MLSKRSFQILRDTPASKKLKATSYDVGTLNSEIKSINVEIQTKLEVVADLKAKISQLTIENKDLEMSVLKLVQAKLFHEEKNPEAENAKRAEPKSVNLDKVKQKYKNEKRIVRISLV